MFGNKQTGIDFDPALDKKYVGIVEDTDDPLRMGRVKARVDWLFGDMPAADIPWANPKHTLFFGKGGQCGQFSVPKKGSVVEIWFNDNNIYAPEYRNIMELADDVRDELAKEYSGTHILGMDGDDDLKMYYTRGKGLTFYLKGSRVNISNDNSITIEHAGTSSIIELRGGTITMTTDSQINMTAGTRIKESSSEVWIDGKTTKVGHSPQYSAVLGEPLFQLLSAMANTIDAKLYPTPGVTSALVEQMKKIIISDTVKVSK
jgi:hypothetical protein